LLQYITSTGKKKEEIVNIVDKIKVRKFARFNQRTVCPPLLRGGWAFALAALHPRCSQRLRNLWIFLAFCRRVLYNGFDKL
jgi:hypothetical protein